MERPSVVAEATVGKILIRYFSWQELEEAALEVGLNKQRTETLLQSKIAELSLLQEQYNTKKNEVGGAAMQPTRPVGPPAVAGTKRLTCGLQVNVIRMVEVELENKIADLEVKLGFESKTRESNMRRLDDGRRKAAQMLGTEDLPPLLSDEELDREKLSDINFRWIPPSQESSWLGGTFCCCGSQCRPQLCD